MSATSLPLVPALRPSWTATLPRQLAVVLGGVVALALFAQLRVEIGPVPITGQTLPVLLLGFAVGPRLAAATVGAYLAIAVAGAPIFSGGAAGWSTMTGATGGYLVGFLVAAVLVGFLAERGWHRNAGTVAAGMVIGNLMIYAIGLLWLKSVLSADWATTISAGLTPFLVGDALKVAIAVALLPAVARHADGLR